MDNKISTKEEEKELLFHYNIASKYIRGKNMEINLVLEALKFMALGMGIVFLFLAIMVYALKLQGKIINKYFPEKEPVKTKIKPVANKRDNEAAKIAAIVAAVQHHKNLKG